MKKEPKWLTREKESILKMTNKQLLESTLLMSEEVGIGCDDGKEQERQLEILKLLEAELNDRLFCWLSKTTPTKVMPT